MKGIFSIALVLLIGAAGLCAQQETYHATFSATGMSASAAVLTLTPKPTKNRVGGLSGDGYFELDYVVFEAKGCAAVGDAGLKLMFEWMDEDGVRRTWTQSMSPDAVGTMMKGDTILFHAVRRSAVTVRPQYTPCASGTWEYDLDTRITSTKKKA